MLRARLVVVMVLTLLLGGATSALAHGGARSALALANASVDIIDSDYQPGSVTISAGDTVTWSQSGQAPHTVTADDGSFDSGELGAGDTFSMRFDSPGTYRYYCTFHGGPGGQGMSAVVVVEGGEASDDPPSVDSGDDEGGTGSGDEAAADTGASLPRTGDGPPPVWVFALALGISGVVLWRVARLTEVAEHL